MTLKELANCTLAQFMGAAQSISPFAEHPSHTQYAWTPLARAANQSVNKFPDVLLQALGQLSPQQRDVTVWTETNLPAQLKRAMRPNETWLDQRVNEMRVQL